MKRIPLFMSTAGLALALSLTACTDDGAGDDENGDDSGDTGDGDRVVVDADITEDTTWTADKTYVLDGLVFVNGATLTIEPGTRIQGVSGSALVINRDAMLMADGTADAPIVFTSNNADNPTRGDWGGLVLIGNATANIGEGIVEGIPDPTNYGGDDDSDNCGTLRYLRVEYAGFALSEGNELNGITFYSCGTGTTVSHVQSHMGLDDGIEMFGGTFDADHIVVTGAVDDSLDMDQGFRGTLEHVFIQQATDVGDNCFEVSNQGTDFAATPKTAPMVCNATCIGSGSSGEKSKGLTVKEGTYGEWYASIFTNTTNEATVLADEATFSEADAGNIELANNIFWDIMGAEAHSSGADSLDSAGWTAWIEDAARANQSVDPGLASIDWTSPDIAPSGDVAGDGQGCGNGYIGAVDPAGDNWTLESWIRYGN